jgi:hypothetical protein
MDINPPAAPPPTLAANATRPQWVVHHLIQGLHELRSSMHATAHRILWGEEESDTEALMATVRQSRLYSDYQALAQQSQDLDYRLVLLSFNTAVLPESPSDAKNFYQGPWPEVRSIIRKIQLQNRIGMELAEAHPDIHYIDTSKDLNGKYDLDLFLDVVHFTPHGDRVMAANTFRGLLPLLMADPKLRCRYR